MLKSFLSICDPLHSSPPISDILVAGDCAPGHGPLQTLHSLGLRYPSSCQGTQESVGCTPAALAPQWRSSGSVQGQGTRLLQGQSERTRAGCLGKQEQQALHCQPLGISEKKGKAESTWGKQPACGTPAGQATGQVWYTHQHGAVPYHSMHYQLIFKAFPEREAMSSPLYK